MIRGGWWIWVSAGVAWGLLCVGVRHAALLAGLEMRQLVDQRAIEVAKVQALERRVAEARRLESIEKLAAAQGFVKAPAGRVVIVAPETNEGFLSRWFGGRAAAEAATPAPRLTIRPRDEVVTSKRPAPKPASPVRHKPPVRKKGRSG